MEQEDYTDDDLDKIASEVSKWEHIEDVYEDDELQDEDEETGEVHESFDSELNEVLSRVERLKLKARFARSKTKRMVKLRIALKRHSNPATLNKKARRLAEKKIKEKITKKKVGDLSVSEKERVERILQKRQTLISRLALRLIPRIKQIEKDRLAKRYVGKK